MAKMKKGTIRMREFLDLSRGCAEATQNILNHLEKKLEVAGAFASSGEVKDILVSFRDDVLDANIGIKNSINYAIMAKQEPND